MKEKRIILISLSILCIIFIVPQKLSANSIDSNLKMGNIEELNRSTGINLNNLKGINLENYDNVDLENELNFYNTSSIKSIDKKGVVELEGDIDIIPEMNVTDFNVSKDNLTFRDKTKGYNLYTTPMDGGVQLKYQVLNKKSSHDFKIDFALKHGQYLGKDNLGKIAIYNKDRSIAAIIANPWAIDSDGNFIKTKYTIDESSLTQHIEYNGNNYPLTADPLFCSDTLNNPATKRLYSSSRYGNYIKAVPNNCARAYIISTFTGGINLLNIFSGTSIGKDIISEFKSDSAYKAIPSSKKNRIIDQFICHAANPITQIKSSWNLEENRKDVSLLSTYKYKCNPPKA